MRQRNKTGQKLSGGNRRKSQRRKQVCIITDPKDKNKTKYSKLIFKTTT